jgi:Ca2+-binding RTX toxin-like protein
MGSHLLAPLVIAAIAALGAAVPASAATVGIEDGESGKVLRYVAEPGEWNELYIMLQSGRFTIQDGTSGTRDTLFVAAEPPCVRDATPLSIPMLIDAYCPPDGVSAIAVDVADGNDYVSVGAMLGTDFPSTIAAGAGADRVSGGPQGDDVRGDADNDTLSGNNGRDLLSGGEGDDLIEAADVFPDRVSCGPGYDQVVADLIDVAAEDCELVAIGAGQPAVIVMRVQEAPTLIGVSRSGLRSRVNCPAACEVKSELLIASRSATAALAGARRRSRLVGRGRASRSAPGILGVRTRLLSGAARRLRRLGRPPLTLRTTVTSGGTNVTVLQGRVRLR